MIWIRSDVSVGSHPKTRKLARRLDVSIPAAVGHLHLLWHWSVVYAEDGSLGRHDAEDVASGAQWDGDPDRFLEALIASGYVDQDEDGIRLHDWHEYAGRLIAINEARREAGRKGAQVRWGSHSKPNGDAIATPMATDSTRSTRRDERTPPTPGDGDVVEKVRAALRAEEHAPEDVEFACARLAGELKTNGTKISSPLSWARAVAKRQASQRRAERPEVECPKCGTKSRGALLDSDDGPVCRTCYAPDGGRRA